MMVFPANVPIIFSETHIEIRTQQRKILIKYIATGRADLYINHVSLYLIQIITDLPRTPEEGFILRSYNFYTGNAY
jgi:hypothetical protein